MAPTEPLYFEEKPGYDLTEEENDALEGFLSSLRSPGLLLVLVLLMIAFVVLFFVDAAWKVLRPIRFCTQWAPPKRA